MRPMGLGKKPPKYSDQCVGWLMQLSKAALADCVVDLLRGQSESCDDPVGESTACDRLRTVIEMRGDLVPETKKGMQEKYERKARARGTFNKAKMIANKQGPYRDR